MELVRKILPLGEPPIRGYLKFAYPLSIAVQHPDFPGWFACNYTQLTYRPDSYTALDFYHYKQVNPLLGEMYLPKSMILKYTSCISFIKDCLDDDHYIYTFLNEYYVPERRAFQKRDFIHDSMIVGYDMDKQVFYIMGYKADRTYEMTEISFDLFEKAFLDYQNKPGELAKWADGMHLYQLKRDQRFQFDVDICREMIEEYLHAQNSSLRYRMLQNEESCAYGMDIYDHMAEHYRNHEYEFSDFRYFHILYEHKKAMTMRLHYLQQTQNASFDPQHLTQSEQLEKRALSLRNACLKYSLTPKQEPNEMIVSRLGEMKQWEREFLEQMVNRIGTHSGIKA